MKTRFRILKIYHRDNNSGWSVAAVLDQLTGEKTTLTGYIPGVEDEMVIEAEGDYVTHTRYGRQFQVGTYMEIMPATKEGIRNYLSSRAIKGIGPALASRIVARFGTAVPDIMDNDIDRLLEVEGIGPQKLRKIREGWASHREISNIMIFLQGHGVFPAYAAKIYRKYRENSITVVRTNPYRLAEEINGIGFKTADEIAASLGIPKDSELRLESGLMYTLEEISKSGHVFAHRDALIERAVSILGVDWEPVEKALGKALESKKLIMEEDAVYLPYFLWAEKTVAERLLAINAFPARGGEIADEKISKALSSSGMEYDTLQIDGIKAAAQGKVVVLTGGPGTGKTTTINGMIKVLGAEGLQINLAAPTGRASKRMTEATGMEAKTIHRLLEYRPEQGFTRDGDNPIDGDVLIVDECSMIDTSLMAMLLKAVPDRMRLVLVGDIDQLPSIGPGNILRDMIASRRFPTITLNLNHRQAEKSRIIANAHKINSGEVPALYNAAGSDFWFMEENDTEAAATTIVSLVKERLPKYCSQFFGRPVTSADIQVLSPMKKGVLGTANLNTLLQEAVNPHAQNKESVTSGSTVFRVGDRVMQTVNDYDKGIFNGSMGIIESINRDDKEVSVRFDGEASATIYDFTELDDLVLSYAATIHKSQGSEYPVVVMPMNMGFYVMLQRNLLYTGVTRAREMMVIVGEKRAVGYAVNRVVIEKRNTRLAARLKEN